MPVLSSTLQEIDDYGMIKSEKFVTERGFELAIEPTPSGLFSIVAKSGGATPTICKTLYTSHMQARKKLIDYVKNSDRRGYAVHPEKPDTQPAKPSPKTGRRTKAQNG